MTIRKSKTILNIAAGKLLPLNLNSYYPYFLVNLDPCFYTSDEPSIIEHYFDEFCKKINPSTNEIRFSTMKANEFMERTKMKFDLVTCYRYLEHVPFTEVSYFIYLLSTVVEIGGLVEIIVPDYRILSNMLIQEAIAPFWNENTNILLTTEMLNEPSCPHASIWTSHRAHHFFENLEGRFKIQDMETKFEFDGRDIYLHFFAKRIK